LKKNNGCGFCRAAIIESNGSGFVFGASGRQAFQGEGNQPAERADLAVGFPFLFLARQLPGERQKPGL
jgi:hypothetical protein